MADCRPTCEAMDVWGLYNLMTTSQCRLFFVSESAPSDDSAPKQAPLRATFVVPTERLRSGASWLADFDRHVADGWGPEAGELVSPVVLLSEHGRAEDVDGIQPAFFEHYASAVAARRRQPRQSVRFCHVRAAFDDVAAALPFFCTAHRYFSVLAGDFPWPSHICSRIFLGGEQTANPLTICELGVTHVVSALESPSHPLSAAVALLHCQVADDESSPIDAFFEPVVAFIRAALACPGARVLVHCRAGISRSACLLAAYLLCDGIDEHTRSPSTQQTLDYLRSRRPCVAPNSGFVKRLHDWEARLAAGRVDELKTS